MSRYICTYVCTMENFPLGRIRKFPIENFVINFDIRVE